MIVTTAMRIPVQFARMVEGGGPVPDFRESTVIEFGTPREVLFASKTPLEFADVLRLRNSDGSFEEDARVVAVQYHPRIGRSKVTGTALGTLRTIRDMGRVLR